MHLTLSSWHGNAYLRFCNLAIFPNLSCLLERPGEREGGGGGSGPVSVPCVWTRVICTTLHVGPEEHNPEHAQQGRKTDRAHLLRPADRPRQTVRPWINQPTIPARSSRVLTPDNAFWLACLPALLARSIPCREPVRSLQRWPSLLGFTWSVPFATET